MIDRALDQGIFDRRDLRTLRLAYELGCGILAAAGISGVETATDLAKLVFKCGHDAKASGQGLKNQAMAGVIAAQASSMIVERMPLALCA